MRLYKVEVKDGSAKSWNLWQLHYITYLSFLASKGAWKRNFGRKSLRRLVNVYEILKEEFANERFNDEAPASKVSAEQ